VRERELTLDRGGAGDDDPAPELVDERQQREALDRAQRQRPAD
jgi:hypothetical protein